MLLNHAVQLSISKTSDFLLDDMGKTTLPNNAMHQLRSAKKQSTAWSIGKDDPNHAVHLSISAASSKSAMDTSACKTKTSSKAHSCAITYLSVSSMGMQGLANHVTTQVWTAFTPEQQAPW